MNERELPPSPEALQSDSSHILVLVKEHTRGFKETNINVSKSIMELFLALCDCHEKMSCPMPKWAGSEMALLACSKISDKKLSPLSKSLLMSACVVQSPHVILGQCFASMSQVKAPVAQEEFLHWMLAFTNEFGAAAIGPGLKETVMFVSEVRMTHNNRIDTFDVTHISIFCSTALRFKEHQSQESRSGCFGLLSRPTRVSTRSSCYSIH